MSSAVSVLKEGITGKISHFTNDEVEGKLLTMGVLPGSLVQIVRIAPFKGGYYLKIDGINLAVRQQEASSIVLEIA
jgi:ferrous iron transport protein A